MDVYTRRIRGWHLSRHLDQTLTLTAWQRALVQHRPEIHHSDQGVQYAATVYTQTLQALGVQISMATVGEATENGSAAGTALRESLSGGRHFLEMNGPLNSSNTRACIPSPLSIEPHDLHTRGQRPPILSHSGAGEASPRKTRPFAPLKEARLMPMLGLTRSVYSPLVSSCLTCFMASGSNASAL